MSRTDSLEVSHPMGAKATNPKATNPAMPTVEPVGTPSPQNGQRTGPRTDIEGLRAVAVALVVGSHLIGLPAGGFIGVDVFFVISGFLITGLLARELGRTDRISFREFYARRARRILPAALVTLVGTCIAARALFFDSRARETYVDSVWAALSLANWHMAAVGTDYFQSTRPPSAVQQFWSLAVEEQFYVVWPIVMMLTWLVTRRLGRRGVRPLVLVLAVITAASFAVAFYQSGTATTVAYFSTLTRAWELGAGGLLAVLASHLRGQARWMSTLLGWGGLAVIAGAAFTTKADATFPAPGALPAVVGTVAVIASGCALRPPTLILLSNPVSRFLGRISYSVYLWHWPVIIFAEALWPDGGLLVILGQLAVVLVLSTLSFVLVEEPIRNTTWLSARHRVPVRRGTSVKARRRYTAVAVVLALVTVGLSLRPEAALTAQPIQLRAPMAEVSGSQAAQGSSTEQKWRDAIGAAVGADTWPELSPSLDELGASRAAEWADCGNVDPATLATCRYGARSASRAKSMVVVGDSVAISWMPAMRTGFEPKGWSIQGLTFGECPAARIEVSSSSGDKSFTTKCGDHQSAALAAAVRLRPGLVVISNTEGTLDRVVGASSIDEAALAWEKAQTAAVKQLKASGAEVVIISSPPARKDLPACATRVGLPADCLSTIGRTWSTMADVDRRVAKATGVKYVDTSGLTCDAQSNCPGFIATTPVMADGVHLTDAMAKQLGPLVFPMITKA